MKSSTNSVILVALLIALPQAACTRSNHAEQRADAGLEKTPPREPASSISNTPLEEAREEKVSLSKDEIIVANTVHRDHHTAPRGHNHNLRGAHQRHARVMTWLGSKMHLIETAAAWTAWITFCMAGLLVLACALYDVFTLWIQRATFASCQKKVFNVHQMLLSKFGDAPLCPYCLDPIPVGSAGKISFICGHAFHESCTHTMLSRQFIDCSVGPSLPLLSPHDGSLGTVPLHAPVPQRSAPLRCPLCEDTTPKADGSEFECSKCGVGDSHHATEPNAEGAPDSSGDVSLMMEPSTIKAERLFFLRSLNRMYPTVVPEAFVKRWSACTTETWLSELVRPKHTSIFSRIMAAA